MAVCLNVPPHHQYAHPPIRNLATTLERASVCLENKSSRAVQVYAPHSQYLLLATIGERVSIHLEGRTGTSEVHPIHTHLPRLLTTT